MESNTFLSEWSPGPNKDYSDNISYQVGETVRLPWELSISNGTLYLWQDNFPDSAQGGPDVLIASKYLTLPLSAVSNGKG